MDLQGLKFNGVSHEKFVDSVHNVISFINGVVNTPPRSDVKNAGMLLTGITIMPLHDALERYATALKAETDAIQNKSENMQSN